LGGKVRNNNDEYGPGEKRRGEKRGGARDGRMPLGGGEGEGKRDSMLPLANVTWDWQYQQRLGEKRRRAEGTETRIYKKNKGRTHVGDSGKGIMKEDREDGRKKLKDFASDES